MQQGPIPGSSINNNDNPNIGDDHPHGDQNDSPVERINDDESLSEDAVNVATDGDGRPDGDHGDRDHDRGEDDGGGIGGGPGDGRRWSGRAWIYGAAILGAIVLAFVFSSMRQQPKLVPEPTKPPVVQKKHGPIPEPTVSVYNVAKGSQTTLKLDDYVAGVVAGEIDNNWPIEAVKAQAIVARTFALQSLEAGKKSRYGTTYSSDFNEFAAYMPQNINANIRAAVTATRGQVLIWEGKAIHAFFHDTSGGVTATAEEGLGFTEAPTPYLQVVKDGPVSDPKAQNWEGSWPKSQIAAAAGVSSFSSIAISQKGPSGRAVLIKVGSKDIKAIDLRNRLGNTKFRSTLIDEIRIEGDKVFFKGRGWGHGVGLAQQGAHDRAKNGQTATQILNLYYPSVMVEQLWK